MLQKKFDVDSIPETVCVWDVRTARGQRFKSPHGFSQAEMGSVARKRAEWMPSRLGESRTATRTWAPRLRPAVLASGSASRAPPFVISSKRMRGCVWMTQRYPEFA